MKDLFKDFHHYLEVLESAYGLYFDLCLTYALDSEQAFYRGMAQSVQDRISDLKIILKRFSL